MIQMHQSRRARGRQDGRTRSNVNALDARAELFYVRWKRAMDILWRETAERRRTALSVAETARAARRLKALRRIVRRALTEYHRVLTRA